MALDFDDLDEQEITNEPDSITARLYEWETTGEWRDPKEEEARKARLEELEKLRLENDEKAKVKAEERRAKRAEREAVQLRKEKAAGKKKARKLRLLCLHGVGSSRALWARQAKKITEALEAKDIEVLLLEAENQCTSAEAVENLEVFFGKKDPKLQYDEHKFDERNWITYVNNERVLDWMQDKLVEMAPIDGILGFSQGANFATMLAAQASCGEGEPLSFVCLISPNAPGYARPLQRLFQEKITVPALIVRGEQETYDVGMGASQFLAGQHIETEGKEAPSEHVIEFFKATQVFTHSGNWTITAPGKEGEAQIAKTLDFIKLHGKM